MSKKNTRPVKAERRMARLLRHEHSGAIIFVQNAKVFGDAMCALAASKFYPLPKGTVTMSGTDNRATRRANQKHYGIKFK